MLQEHVRGYHNVMHLTKNALRPLTKENEKNASRPLTEETTAQATTSIQDSSGRKDRTRTVEGPLENENQMRCNNGHNHYAPADAETNE